MHLFLLGVSHKTTPVELRERLDFAARGLGPALEAISRRPGSSEAGALAPHLYERVDAEAAQYLFRVAGGLDSLVVGEPQILGQVKGAFAAATEKRTVGPVLNKVFPWSFTVGERVRTETALSEGAVSIGFAATSLARKIFGDLKGRTAVVIGAGEMGELTAQHLQGQGVGRMLIMSRTLAHASALASSIGGTAVPWAELFPTLGQADIVISATGSQLPILTRPQAERVMRGRRNRPLFLIDIALPRDIDPAVGDLESVFLYNIDDFQAIPDPERVRVYADALTRLFALDAEDPARVEPGRDPAARRADDAGTSVTS